MNQLVIKQANNREELVFQYQQLTAQLKALQFQLFDKTSPDVVEHINQLQLEKAKQQGILQHAQQQLAQLNPELENFDTGAEQILLEAISQQRWYAFKNKREIILDSSSGYLFPNFKYIRHINSNDWDKSKKEYAPHGIGRKLWQGLHEINKSSRDSGVVYDPIYTKFPSKYAGSLNVQMYYKYDSYYSFPFRYIKDFNEINSNYTESSTDAYSNIANSLVVFPFLKLEYDSPLYPQYSYLTTYEKAKIILDYFLKQDWIPDFEPFLEKNKDEDNEDFQERLAKAQKQCDEYNRIFDAYYKRIQLQKQLVELEVKISELPEPEPENLFTSDFDYRIDLKNYHLTEINTSVWQYSLAAQKWINDLLAQIDDWENRHQHLLENALELNTILAKKLPTSLNLNNIEQEFLNSRHSDLQQRLNFSLEPLRSTLIDLLKQNQDLEENLQHTHSLTALAELEQQSRPSFALLAEHSAILCTQTLKKLEWLENSLDFVQEIVQSEQQSTEDYLILLDKYQQDIKQIGADASIEAVDIEKWFAEWRQERFLMLQQWQPLVEAGLNGVIAESSVLETLDCIKHYQQSLDQFYREKRLGIHTSYAFQANGYRQEKLEKEQELTKLNHQFMQDLEKVIFASSNTTQKIWLVRFSEVWQQGIVDEIIKFLSNENLLERSDIAQMMSEEMRKIQQQNLAACLQDAKSYSQALAQREKETNALIFKMRKTLQKGEK